jgi:hypothetical protein
MLLLALLLVAPQCTHSSGVTLLHYRIDYSLLFTFRLHSSSDSLVLLVLI